MTSESSSRTSLSPPNDARKWQTVFRVRLNPQAAPSQTRRPVPEKRKASRFRHRRSHRKSKAGCLVCKRRRVKCDEMRPGCRNCSNYGVTCSYPTDPSGGTEMGTVGPLGDPSMVMFSMSLDNLATNIEETLSMHSVLGYHMARMPGSDRPIEVLALRHFVDCTVETISTPSIRKLMRTEAVRVAFSNPHVMHTIIGVALLHLNRILPFCNVREVAEAHHWQKAIQFYRKALSHEVSAENIDALLTTCMLMAVNCMCPENFTPKDSWVLNSDPSAMNWIYLQNGLPYLLEIGSPFIPLSIWGPAFEAAEKAHNELLNDCPQGRQGMHPRLADFCGITDLTTDETSPYFKPLQVVSSMLDMEKSASTAGYFSSFLGHLDPRFLELLRAKDTRALVVIAHWMGIMCLISHWEPWVEGRIRSECLAICIHLTPKADTQLLELLRFPSIASGFTDS
ncbi:C6 zinc finger domain-containing protein [Nannizzia gypsea CBS 118893]|uniref:C6 zinc finger domain-containing protein n=1 Tax=Arthroderma gypseum (strain ATCC MYA-4604 / CBS 118893) TaxID=535722 RepID=E4US75_ARTGP|nr:C6 zinc finger domain-containing protein [Nannizzia gypsea CBS 118893]EFR00493.1 C6 zinc finger domain-containing protein [Nannizzia gypsea CBS 118893]